MKNFFKPCLALVLVICLLLSAAPVPAFAAAVPAGPVLPDPDAFFRYRLSSEKKTRKDGTSVFSYAVDIRHADQLREYVVCVSDAYPFREVDSTFSDYTGTDSKLNAVERYYYLYSGVETLGTVSVYGGNSQYKEGMCPLILCLYLYPEKAVLEIFFGTGVSFGDDGFVCSDAGFTDLGENAGHLPTPRETASANAITDEPRLPSLESYFQKGLSVEMSKSQRGIVYKCSIDRAHTDLLREYLRCISENYAFVEVYYNRVDFTDLADRPLDGSEEYYFQYTGDEKVGTVSVYASQGNDYYADNVCQLVGDLYLYEDRAALELHLGDGIRFADDGFVCSDSDFSDLSGNKAQNLPSTTSSGGTGRWIYVDVEVDCPSCTGGVCSICHGNGYVIGYTGIDSRVSCNRRCSSCGGRGTITQTQMKFVD